MGQKIIWGLQLFGTNFLIVCGIYFSFTYFMLQDAYDEKAEKEEEMRLEWLAENGYVSL